MGRGCPSRAQCPAPQALVTNCPRPRDQNRGPRPEPEGGLGSDLNLAQRRASPADVTLDAPRPAPPRPPPASLAFPPLDPLRPLSCRSVSGVAARCLKGSASQLGPRGRQNDKG